MDSTPVTITDGLIDAFATEHKKRTKEIYGLRNFLKKYFELYITMNIDHTLNFKECAVLYQGKRFFITINGFNYRDFRKITDLCWELHRLGVRNPNARSEWTKV